MNLLSAFENFNQAVPARGALAALRQAGRDYAQQKGLPTRKEEDWHYTSVKAIAETSFVLPSDEALNHEELAYIKARLNPEFTNLVFVNGALNQTLSSGLPAELSFQESARFNQNFSDTFEAINGAYQAKAYDIVVGPETSVARPINLVFFSASRSASVMTHPRLNIQVGARSAVKFLESYYGFAGSSYLVNSVVDVQVGESAKVTYIRLQSESEKAFNIGRTRLTVAAHANLESLAFATGAQLSRHTLEVFLNGAGSHSEVLGLYATRGEQHVDNTTTIAHHVGGCDSNQLYKGILDGESRGVFCGKVLIAKDAQKANSAQLNNNLLLSPKAEADSKPNLEIYADDVKASHGSTVGQLNKEELFYLQSRGIKTDKAVPMLSYGYLSEVVYRISDESLQHWLTRHLDEAFQRFSLKGGDEKSSGSF